MRFRLSATLPLPICVLLLTTCTLFAQDSDNPFSDQSDPFGTTTKVTKTDSRAPVEEDFDSEKLKAFEADIKRFQKEYADMLKREQVLTQTVEKLLEDNRMGSLLKNYDDADQALKARVSQLTAKLKSFEQEITQTANQNKALKMRIKQLDASEAEAKQAAAAATNNRNEMHQKLFETLLNSCLLYTSPSPRDKRQSRMPSSA